jgi:hypothetical protein
VAEGEDRDELWDEDRRKFRPAHRGRIRATGDGGGAGDRGELIEVWEGGRMIGYEKTRPDARGCKLPLHG